MSEFDQRCHWILLPAKFLVFSLLYQTLTYLSEICARRNLIFAPGSKRIATAMGFGIWFKKKIMTTSLLSEASRNWDRDIWAQWLRALNSSIGNDSNQFTTPSLSSSKSVFDTANVASHRVYIFIKNKISNFHSTLCLLKPSSWMEARKLRPKIWRLESLIRSRHDAQCLYSLNQKVPDIKVTLHLKIGFSSKNMW